MKTTRLIRVNIVFAISFCTVFILMFSSCKELYPITKTAEGYTFEIDENQNATLIKTDILAETIEIPSEISSYKVKKLSCVEEAALVGVSLTGVFEGNNVVKEIIIPEGVVKTYGPAIANCYNLEKITIPGTMTTFDVVRCDNLKEVNIVDGDTITESFSFSDCSGLEEIYLPKQINKISTNAFARCYSLKNVKFSKNVYCIESVAFQGCTSLTNIDLPDKLSEIGSNAFQCCTSLQTIDVPSKVRIIESWTFDGCKSLEIVNLPEDLIKIGDGAFRDCVSLERINAYDECDYIADNAFDGCDKLTICGIKGSYAEQYAKKHNIPFEKLDTTIQSVN